MWTRLENLFDQLITWLESVGAAGEPSLVILVNVLILALVAVMIAGRIRAEMKSQQWLKLTLEERRQKIYDILVEAYQTAEWLFSHITLENYDQKQAVAADKKKAALTYARRELGALGAGGDDLATLSTRLEKVAMDLKPGRERYSDVPWETPK